MHDTQHKAFTLIELIFVIVVVGILAIVAIPRLAASRDDANAARCTHEVQQILSEIAQNYTIKGYLTFSMLPIEEITNVSIGVIEKDGISSPQATLVSSGITYMCDGEDIVEIKGIHAGVEYNISVTDLNPSSPPAAVSASELIRKLNDITIAGGSRSYSLE